MIYSIIDLILSQIKFICLVNFSNYKKSAIILRIGDNMSIVYDWKVNIDDNELEEICSFLEKGELVVFQQKQYME